MTGEKHHRIEWRHNNETVAARIVCVAPVGAWCRCWCPTCDEVCTSPGAHTEVDQGSCGVAPQFDDISLIPELYDGPADQPVRDGFIGFTWDGEIYLWQYAEVTQ